MGSAECYCAICCCSLNSGGRFGSSLPKHLARRKQKLEREIRRRRGEKVDADDEEISGLKHQYIALTDNGSIGESPSPPMTATSEESFDYLTKGEASVYGEL